MQVPSLSGRWRLRSKPVFALLAVVLTASGLAIGTQVTSAAAADECTEGPAQKGVVAGEDFDRTWVCSLKGESAVRVGAEIEADRPAITNMPANEDLWFACQKEFKDQESKYTKVDKTQGASTWWVLTKVNEPTSVQSGAANDLWKRTEGWGWVAAPSFNQFSKESGQVNKVDLCDPPAQAPQTGAQPASNTPAAPAAAAPAAATGPEAGAYDPNLPMRLTGAPGECKPVEGGAECDVWQSAPLFRDGKLHNNVLPVGKYTFACQFDNKQMANPQTSNEDGTVNNNNHWLWIKSAPAAAGDTAARSGWVPATFIAQGGSGAAVPGVAPCGDKKPV
jgi:hypothetical protein